MKTKITNAFAFLALVVLVLTNSCDRNCDLQFGGTSVTLVIPYKMYPDSDTMYIGDTLWVEIDFNKELQIHSFDRSVVLDETDLGITFFITEASGEEELTSSSYVDIIPVLGDVVGFSSAVTDLSYYPLTPIETTDRYQFKMGVILRETGLFSIGLASLVDTRFISHPSLTVCENGKGRGRELSIDMAMHNEMGSYENLDFLMSNSQVPYFTSPVLRRNPPIYSGMGVRVLER